jgi:hypothetical protein
MAGTKTIWGKDSSAAYGFTADFGVKHCRPRKTAASRVFPVLPTAAAGVRAMKKTNKPSLTQHAMQALTEAVAKVVEDHRRRAKPLAVWRDGKAVWIHATETGTLHETTTPYRTKMSGGKP